MCHTRDTSRIEIPQRGEASLGRAQSFIAGSPKNIQFMVKDSKKYGATGGWGSADFTDGKPADEVVHKTCFPCHEPGKASGGISCNPTQRAGLVPRQRRIVRVAETPSQSVRHPSNL